MRRPPLLALLLCVLTFVACTAAPPSGPVAPLSPRPRATFVVDAPGAATEEPQYEGDRIVAAIGKRFVIFDRPSQRHPLRYPSRNDWGQELWLPTIGAKTDERGHVWFHVLVPERPNGSDGWVREREVEVDDVRDRLDVDLGSHTLAHYRGDEVVRRYTVAVGAPGTPTATGRFFVWARVGYRDVTGPYGNFALGLSGFSDVITEWPGGGRMAVHGTSDPNDAGYDVSHGCVRVFNPQMARLIDVPMGARVVIHP